MDHFAYFIGAYLFFLGLYGVVTSRNLVHLIVCLSVVQSSTYLVLLGIGYRKGGAPPILLNVPKDAPIADSVVQAMMLTDVVVEVTVMALLLALAVQAHKRAGTLNPDRLGILRG